MNIKQLIEQLQQYDPETMVVITGREGGFNEVSEISEISLKLNANTSWYYGKHEESHDENGILALQIS